MNTTPKKILILSANPTDTSKLRLDEEAREIQAGLQRSRSRDKFELITRLAVHPDDLRRALLDHSPQIVHFCGHGAGSLGLALENHTGQTQLVSTESLARLFKLFKDKVECVLLNACYSQEQAEAIYQHIDCVIGMNQVIGDRASIEFAVGFYDALGADRSYEEAYEFGCSAIDLEGINESSIPVLKSRKNELDSQQQGQAQSNRAIDKNQVVVLDNPYGSVPLDSDFYVERPPIEADCYEIILFEGALIRIKAPRQMGKTSLMTRILDYAKRQDYQIANLNFQSVDAELLTNLDLFLQWFCASVSDGSNLPDKIGDYWRGVLDPGHQSVVNSVSFSQNGQRITTFSSDNTAQVWDVSNKPLALLTGHQGKVNSASFSPDGQHIVTASDDDTARVWDIKGLPVAVLTGHKDKVKSASFSPNGQYIITVSQDNTARVWDIKGSPLAVLIGHEGKINSASFSPNGQRIVTASSDSTARLWDLKGQELALLQGHDRNVNNASFSPDGQLIVTASNDTTARLWNLTGKQIAMLSGHISYVNSATFSPDGQHILTASDGKTARLWELNGKQILLIKGHTSYVNSATFSPDGQRIVTASDDNTAREWDMNGKQLAVLSGHESAVWSANFSPDGQRIVTASDDKTTRVWDLDGRQLAQFRGIAVRFSPDGRYIVTVSDDGVARLWQVGGLDELLARGCDWLKEYFVTHPEAQKTLKVCQQK